MEREVLMSSPRVWWCCPAPHSDASPYPLHLHIVKLLSLWGTGGPQLVCPSYPLRLPSPNVCCGLIVLEAWRVEAEGGRGVQVGPVPPHPHL